jgi:heat-inducible transcriptional repressor
VHPLPERQRQVLQATVRHYVDTTEPVGSRTLVRRFGLPASPATVRSAMGALEQRGLLLQPHTSAGRIPSQKGYRHYVDCLLPAPGAGARRLEQELAGLTLGWASLDDLLQQLARRLADFTGLLSLVTRPRRPSSGLQALRLVPSGERLQLLLVEDATRSTHLNVRLPLAAAGELPALERWVAMQLEQRDSGAIDWRSLPPQLQTSGGVVRQALRDHAAREGDRPQATVTHGLSGLLAQPEFHDAAGLRGLIRLIEEAPQELVPAHALTAEGIWIGREHPHADLQHCAVVLAPYRCGGGAAGGERGGGERAAVGHVGLIGPMRMAYASARAAVRSAAAILQRLLN